MCNNTRIETSEKGVQRKTASCTCVVNRRISAMDQRIALEKNSILHFPGMECVIGSCVGKGSNVIAYTGSYRDSQNPSLSHLVLIRELYPYDPEGGISRSVKVSKLFRIRFILALTGYS